MNHFSEEIAKGIALLDAKDPGWVNLISVDALTMSDVHNCVLGQLYGDYYDGVGILLLDDYTSDCGFDVSGEKLRLPAPWHSLTSEWKQAILDIKNSQ